MDEGKSKQELLEMLGLDDDPAWQNASIKELASYRRIVPFYHFWFWEYQRRNEGYKKEFINSSKTKTKLRDDHILCDPSLGPLPSEIIEALCDGSFERREPKPFFWLCDIGLGGYQIEYKWSFDKYTDEPKIDISCCPTFDSRIMAEHCRMIFVQAREDLEKAKKLFQKESYEKKELSWDEHIWLHGKHMVRDLSLLEPPANGKRRPKDSDEKRAAGLWLRDYLQEAGGSKAQAIRNFRKSFPLEKIGLEDTPERKFYVYLDNAEKCIQKCQVLPL